MDDREPAFEQLADEGGVGAEVSLLGSLLWHIGFSIKFKKLKVISKISSVSFLKKYAGRNCSD